MKVRRRRRRRRKGGEGGGNMALLEVVDGYHGSSSSSSSSSSIVFTCSAHPAVSSYIPILIDNQWWHSNQEGASIDQQNCPPKA